MKDIEIRQNVNTGACVTRYLGEEIKAPTWAELIEKLGERMWTSRQNF